MNKAVLTFISFFFILFVYGQNNPKTLLWKVTKKGSRNESYLFGTFHEVNPSFFNTLTNAVDKLRQSDILFIEEKSSTRAKFTSGEQTIWNSAKWKAILTKEQEEVFASFSNRAKDTVYYRLNPLMLALAMSRFYLTNYCDTGSGFTDLMDDYIERSASKANKLIRSLDSSQNNILNKAGKNSGILQDSQYANTAIHCMKSMLDNNLSDCGIISAYRNFELDYELDKELTEESPQFQLLIDRNNSWILVLDKAFSFNNCFVAVGFKHLFYKQGLIQQLRKLGYDVVPVPPRP